MVSHIMPTFGLILVLLLAKTLAQENPVPVFREVGKTLDVGFCFGVDYVAVYRINEGDKQLLWNSSDSIPPPDAYKNRINGSNPSHVGFLGLQVMDLKMSDSGLYLSECWFNGKIINQHTHYVYVCEEEIPSQEVFIKNGSAVLDCDIRFSEHDSTSIKWFRQVYPGYTLFLDTERSQEILQDELDEFLQVLDKGFLLYISEESMEQNQNFFCLVMNKGQCKSFKNIQLPESNKPEMQFVYYAVGEKAVLSCMSEHWRQQQNYWKTPFGEVTATTPHSQMYTSAIEGTRAHALVIPSITFNHSGEYICMSKLFVVEYFITVCTELASKNVQMFNNEKVIMSCTFTTNESVSILWYRQRHHPETQLIYDSGDPSIDLPDDMMGRTHISDTNASLIISKLNVKDSGTYWCVVLLDSVGHDIDFYDDEEEEEEEGESDWTEEEENTEPCIFKSVTQLKVQLKTSKILNVDGQNPQTGQNPQNEYQYAIIGGVLGIVILGLIIVVVVVKMRVKRKASASGRAEPTPQQRDSASATPLM